MSELEIPEAALSALETIIDSSHDYIAALNSAAPLIVAAELRRIAATWRGPDQPQITHVPPSYIRQVLWNRADELDPGGRTR